MPSSFYVFVLVASLCGLAKTDGTESSRGYLGTVEGKTYLVDPVNRTWTDSKEFCITKQMRLATITTKAQAEFLKSVLSPDFQYAHWIGGRDAMSVRRMEWDQSKTTVSDGILPLWMYKVPISACLAYENYEGAKSPHFDILPCSDKLPCLCEK